MKALVTGGNGFLGSAIVRLLAERGDEVRTLSRAPAPMLHSAFPIQHSQADGVAQVQSYRTRGHDSPPPHSPIPIQHFQTDIRDAARAKDACAGMDVVFHVAAKAGVWGPASEYESINIEGTRNVINACRECGVARLVYTSSPSVVFGRDDLCGVDESVPYPDTFLAPYPRTKAIAEQMVLTANGPSLATVALRPHLIWGPGDPHLLPRIIDRARKGKLRQVGDGTNLVDITYIDNAAHAHLLAADCLSATARCAGRAYFISNGEPVCLWAWLGELLALLQIPSIKKRISLPFAYAIGAALETTHRLLGLKSEPPMTRFVANQVAKSHYFDISAARRDLGYEPRVSLREGMARTIDWLKRFPAR